MTGLEILEKAVAKYNDMDFGDYKIPVPLDTELPLYGLRSPLDSLAFVAFVMTVEETLQEVNGEPYNLTTQVIMDRAFSIFGTIGSMACFLDGFNGNSIQKTC